MSEFKLIFVVIPLFGGNSALVFSSGMSRKSKYFLQNVGVIFSSPYPLDISEMPAEMFSKYNAKAITSPGVNIPLAALMTAKPYISTFVRIFTS